MSFEVRFDNGAGDHLATTKAWCNVTRWIESLPKAQFPALHALAADGQSDAIEELDLEIQEALELKLPSAQICATLRALIKLVDANIDADQLIISSGA